MKETLIIVKDVLLNRDAPRSVKIMPPARNDNKRQTPAITLERLTKDINQQLLREMDCRMRMLQKTTNFTAEEIAIANVKAASRFYITALNAVTNKTAREKIILEFDSLTNVFLK